MLTLDTAPLPDGFHELRVVAVAAGPIETQGRIIVPVKTDNHGHTIEFTATLEPDGTASQVVAADGQDQAVEAAADVVAPWDRPIELAAKAPGMSGIEFSYNGRVLSRTEGDTARLRFNPRRLGTGPIAFRAAGKAAGPDGPSVVSSPIRLRIASSPPLPAWQPPKAARFVRGLQLRLAGDKIVPVQETFPPTWLRDAGVTAGEAFELEGAFDVPDSEIYQFQLWHDGDLKLSVDGQLLYEGAGGDEHERFIPVVLAKGMHRMTLAGQAGPNVRVRIAFGGEGTFCLSGADFGTSASEAPGRRAE